MRFTTALAIFSTSLATLGAALPAKPQPQKPTSTGAKPSHRLFCPGPSYGSNGLGSIVPISCYDRMKCDSSGRAVGRSGGKAVRSLFGNPCANSCMCLKA
ncbi:hypothetical protein GGTG_07714 [Gaeumannomyces tritici R3-111a-1]|uniref:Uncharacterized protein n=1 Tax=Gaeumannomyces tritici (strain R3-111a-1) TaxID=644352 RepID=J3P2G7_GAET3|nr:hypothetical protein GGTG_07714 [Gaeumannomyces tritici R3-111a-1]EJT73859.1 hypothetical protein GGTG_07714 [Gaeumannomyces tritici R3-111a-1]